jgi:hypothetical protein
MHLFHLVAKIVDAVGVMIGPSDDLLSFANAVSSDDTIFLLMVFLYEVMPPAAFL